MVDFTLSKDDKIKFVSAETGVSLQRVLQSIPKSHTLPLTVIGCVCLS